MARYIIFLGLYLILMVSARRKHSYHPNFSRIVGGYDTDIKSVPYQVCLIYNYQKLCGGAIITKTAILTAAHCVLKGTPKDYLIRVGSNSYAEGGIVRFGHKIIIHPKYDKKITNYDAAIVTFIEPLIFSESVQVIPLALKEPHPGDKILVSGWGARIENGGAHKVLQSVKVPIVDREKCQKSLTKGIPISHAMICAGYPEGGKDACQGDSGGPAVSRGFLVGVVSFGVGCARKHLPGVYVNVAKIRIWVQSNLH